MPTKDQPPLVTLYGDGACLGNPGPGGYGTVLLFGKHRKELSAGYRKTTNNRMELLGVLCGLEILKRPCALEIVSDSKYVVEAMQKSWPQRWRDRGWRTSGKSRAANVDLWVRVLAAAELHTVEWKWVKGHSGNRENERCDQLALAAAQGKNLAVDSGYEELTKTLFDS